MFLMWGLIMFVATTGQIRFAEYLTVSFALLSAFLIWKVVDWIPAVLKFFEFKAPERDRERKDQKEKGAIQAGPDRRGRLSLNKDATGGKDLTRAPINMSILA